MRLYRTALGGSLAALALACGCRTDGGLGRVDSDQSLAFATRAFAAHTQRDLANTEANFSDLPGKLRRSVTAGLHEMERTWHLYLDAHAPR